MNHAFDGICELVLETADVTGLAGFYHGLGLEVLDAHDDRVWLAAGPRVRLGIWSPGEKEHADRGGSHVHFALAAPRGTLLDLETRLRAAGHDVKGPIEHDGGDRSLYVFDPEGNRVELWDYFHDGDGAQEGVGALRS
jgi:catechol-2,3-dioxygenase